MRDKLTISLIVVIVVFLVVIQCQREDSGDNPQIKQDIAKIETQIKHHEQDRDSVKAKASKVEEKQKDVKKTYRQAVSTLGQGNSPCRDSIIQVVQLCDTVIFVDSVLIVELKEVIRQDSLVISSQKKLIAVQKENIRADSLTIIDLTKTVKKEKRKKKLAWIVAGIAAVGNLVR